MKIKSISRVLSCAALWLLLAGFLSPRDAIALDLLSTDNANGRYFTDQSGKAVYLVGSHTWNNFLDGAWATGRFTNLGTFDYEEYLLWMQGLNHNFIRLWTPDNSRDFECDQSECDPEEEPVSPTLYERMTDEQCTNAGGGANCLGLDGLRKFDLDRLNPLYFLRLDDRIVEAGYRNIYVAIMLFDASGLGVYGSGDSTVRDGRVWWNGHAYNKLNNIQQIDGGDRDNKNGLLCQTESNPEITALQERYVQEVIETVKDLNNVLYDINNEGVGRVPADELDSTKWQYQMIDFIKNTEAASSTGKMHPVGMTGFTFNYQNNELLNSNADWISPRHYFENFETEPPETSGDKVVILDSDHLYNNLDAYDRFNTPPSFDDRAKRTWVWKSFTRGYNPIYMDQMYLDPDFGGASISQAFDSSPPFGHSPHAEEVRKAMGHTRSYANRMNLIEMTPQENLSSTHYVLAKVQFEYLVYQPDDLELPGAQPFTVTLPHGIYSVEWFDPNTGETQQGANKTVGFGPVLPVTFNPPYNPPDDFIEDAVLYLKNLTVIGVGGGGGGGGGE
jgi:hypothetical protein